MNFFTTVENCPKCLRPARGWRERPEHGSREIYWIGCRSCGQFSGGLSENIARQNWIRLAERLKQEMLVLHIPLGSRYDGARA